MKIILILLGIVVTLAIAAFVIRFIFENFLVSRILCLVCAAICIIDAFTGIGKDQIWDAVLFTVLSWLFYRGEHSLETFETGWIIIDGFGNETVETVGGLVGHAILPTIIAAGLYFYVGVDFPIVYILLPALIAVLDVISFFNEF